MEEQLQQISGYAHIVQLLMKCRQYCERAVIGGSQEISQRESKEIAQNDELTLEALIDETVLYDVTDWLNRAIEALNCITDAQQKETADELVRLLEISDHDGHEMASGLSHTQWQQTLANFDDLQYGESSPNNVAASSRRSQRFTPRDDSSALLDYTLLHGDALATLDSRYGSEISVAPAKRDIGRSNVSTTLPQTLINPHRLTDGQIELPIATSRQHSVALTNAASDLSILQKRRRRRWADVSRPYYCTWQDCEKSYGTMSHLNTHIKAQNHGKPKHLTDYPEVTEASSSRSSSRLSPPLRSRTARVEAAAAAAAAHLQRSSSPLKKRRLLQQEGLDDSSELTYEAATAIGKRPMLRPRNSDETDEEDLEVALSKGSLDLLLRAIKVVKVLKQSGEYV